ncbi:MULTISPECIES: ribosome maturation factor RimM [unclassified Ekhidna]|jgi:16S rRNA processing protein RimM|uniref:ribosome maturation factor RimM n=1 Tax=unclassified Ekhidna TaxID=2632188 RepID=UPI0032DF7EBC
MRQDDCYQLGEVIKTHGLNGEVSILLDVDFPNEYQNLESVFLEQSGKLVPFFIDTIQINGNKALVQFEDILSLDDAKELVKSKLFLPLSSLPKLDEGQYYFHELVDCEVFEDGKLIGTAKNVIDLNGNQLLSVDANGKEILIPLKDEILLSADIKKQKLTVKLPDGLLDMYLEGDSDAP